MEVNQFGHHGLSCKSSQGRTACHNSLNDIIYHSLATAKVPSRLEPHPGYTVLTETARTGSP